MMRNWKKYICLIGVGIGSSSMYIKKNDILPITEHKEVIKNIAFYPVSISNQTQRFFSTSQNLQKRSEEKVLLQHVPFIRQAPELDRGCEVTSLAMMLQYAGVTVNKMTLAEEIPKIPFLHNGLRGNPNEGFVGNIYTFSESGYGVYHKPLFQLANKYLPNQVVDLTGENIEGIYERIRAGNPVVMITNATYAPLDADEFRIWKTKTGNVSITYNEHCVLLIGYDKESVYIHDPLSKQPSIRVSRENFEQAWVQMGSQAISMNEKRYERETTW
ncbi:C39 family peptidase [Bacillus cytotoxicus]